MKKEEPKIKVEELEDARGLRKWLRFGRATLWSVDASWLGTNRRVTDNHGGLLGLATVNWMISVWTAEQFSLWELSHLEQNSREIHLRGDCPGLLYWKQRMENKWRVLIKKLFFWLKWGLAGHGKEVRKIDGLGGAGMDWKIRWNCTGEMELRKGKGFMDVVRCHVVMKDSHSSVVIPNYNVAFISAQVKCRDRSWQRVSRNWVLVGPSTRHWTSMVLCMTFIKMGEVKGGGWVGEGQFPKMVQECC